MRKPLLNLAGCACLCLLLAGASAWVSGNDSPSRAWTKLAPMPAGKFIHRSLVVNGRLYAIAGAYPPTFYAGIKDDGTLEPWKMAAPLAVNYPAAAAKGSRIYIVSGSREKVTLQNSVYYGDVEPDGNIKAWKEGRVLPDDCRQGGEAVVLGNHLFYIGGWHVREVYCAPILDNGDLGEWRKVQHLLSPRFGMGTGACDDSLYVFGGNKTHLNPTDSAYRGSVLPDGTIKSWKRTASLPLEIAGFATVQSEDRFYIMGGGDFTSGVFSTRLRKDGNLGDWQPEPSLPLHVCLAGAAAYRGWVYFTGGWVQREDGSRIISNEVYALPINPRPT